MHFEKIHNKGQARLFKNDFLEALTKAHPLVIWGMYIPIMTFLIYTGATTYNYSTKMILLIFFSGVFFWSFFEYIMHMFVFHWVSDNPKIQRMSYVLHGNHHEFPRDKQRLFMPPVPSLIIASLIFLLMYAVMREYVFSFFAGFILGYLMYGSMHYAIHAWNPRYKWMKPIWRNHHLHHYKSEEKGFGVSSHLWDKIFGTAFDLKKEKENKEEVQKLMYTKKPSRQVKQVL